MNNEDQNPIIRASPIEISSLSNLAGELLVQLITCAHSHVGSGFGIYTENGDLISCMAGGWQNRLDIDIPSYTEDGVCVLICNFNSLSLQFEFSFGASVKTSGFSISMIEGSSHDFWLIAKHFFFEVCSWGMLDWASCSSWLLSQEIYEKYVFKKLSLSRSPHEAEWVRSLQGTSEASSLGLEMVHAKMIGWMGLLPVPLSIVDQNFCYIDIQSVGDRVYYQVKDELIGDQGPDMVLELLGIHSCLEAYM